MMSTISQSSYNQLVDPNDPNRVFESGSTYTTNGELVSATINEKEANQYIFDNFNAFDKDGSGSLTQTEITQRLDTLGVDNRVENIFTGKTLSNNHHEQIYEKYIAPADLDKNGEVTAQELQDKFRLEHQPQADGITAIGPAPNQSDSQQKFVDSVVNMFSNEKINTNGDWFIDKKEALAAGYTQEQWDNTYKHLDLDGNNKLSVGEWLSKANEGKDIDIQEFAKNYGESTANTLAKYDLNNDGTVTQDEIKSYDKQMDKSNDSIIDKFKNLSTEAKVGIIISGIVVIAAIVALIVALATRKSKKKEENAQLNIQQQIPTGQQGMMPQAYMMPMQPQMYCMPQYYAMPQANYGYSPQNVGYNVSNNLNSINRSQGMQM